jgi:3-oxoacyl-[acyl-carrier-protein] synthase III
VVPQAPTAYSRSAVRFNDLALASVAYVEPPVEVSSGALEARLAPTLARLKLPSHPLRLLTGIEARRAWTPGTPLADSAGEAARKALVDARVDASEVGLLVSTSVSREGLEPSLASSVHARLDLPSEAQAYDLGNACLGFLNGIEVAGRMIEAGVVHTALVVAAEDSTPVVEATLRRLSGAEVSAPEFWANFATLTLGSMAVAAVLRRGSLAPRASRVHGSVALADTRQNHLCRGDATGMVTDSTALLRAGVALAGRTWARAAEELPRWSASSIDAYVCHQVGRAHLGALSEALHIPLDRCFPTYARHGNVGPAAVPFTLARAVEAGAVRPGDHVALMGIGSGLNVSMMSVTW